MFAKTLILALVLAGASLTFIGNVSATPARDWQPTHNYMSERHNPADTNGN
jgi:phosphomannomutase